MNITGKTQQDSSKLQGLYYKVKFMKASNHSNTVRLFELMETEDKTFCHGIVQWRRVPSGSWKLARKRDPSQILPDKVCNIVDFWHQKFIICRDLETKPAPRCQHNHQDGRPLAISWISSVTFPIMLPWNSPRAKSII